MKGIKRLISMFLCCVIAAAIFTVMPIAAFAATEPDHAYWNYTAPTVVLKKGNSMTKSNVKWLQSALNDLAYRGDINNKKLNLRSSIGDDYLTVDGSFGTKTDKAVRAFQSQYSLAADGAFGTNSRNKMKAVLKSKTSTVTTTCPHYYGNWEIRKEATCGTTGIQYRYCKKCGYEATQTIPATGNHDCRSGWIIGKERGCFTPGERHKVCAICHKNVNSEPLPAYNCHNWEEWSIIQEATSTKTGRRRQYCSRCGGYQEEDIPCKPVQNDKEQKFRTMLQEDFTSAELDILVSDVKAFYGETDHIRQQTKLFGRWFELSQMCTGCEELSEITSGCLKMNKACDYLDLAWTAWLLANNNQIDQTQLPGVIESLKTLCSKTPYATYYKEALNSILDATSQMMEVVKRREFKDEFTYLGIWLEDEREGGGAFLDMMTYAELAKGGKVYKKAYAAVVNYYKSSSVSKKLFNDEVDYWNYFLKLKEEQSRYGTVKLSNFLSKHYGV